MNNNNHTNHPSVVTTPWQGGGRTHIGDAAVGDRGTANPTGGPNARPRSATCERARLPSPSVGWELRVLWSWETVDAPCLVFPRTLQGGDGAGAARGVMGPQQRFARPPQPRKA